MVQNQWVTLSLLVAGFDAQNCGPADGCGQLSVLTHEAPGAEKFGSVALSIFRFRDTPGVAYRQG